MTKSGLTLFEIEGFENGIDRGMFFPVGLSMDRDSLWNGKR